MILQLMKVLLVILLVWIIFVGKRALSNRLILIAMCSSQLILIVQITLLGLANEYQYNVTFFVISLFICMLLNLIVFWRVKRIKQHHTIIKTKKNAELQLNSQEERLEEGSHHSEELNDVILEMHMQIQELREGIAQNHSQAGKLVESYLKRQNQQKITTSYCQNSVIDAVLIHKYERAKSIGIELQIAVELAEDIPIKSLDLCSLFVNLLDNAIEACEVIMSKGNQLYKYIHIACYKSSGYLVIYCRNSKQNEIVQRRNGTIKSSKSTVDREHGLGISIIRDIAAQYDGTNKIEYGTHFFVHSVYLSLSTSTYNYSS